MYWMKTLMECTGSYWIYLVLGQQSGCIWEGNGIHRCSPDAEDSDVPWRCNGDLLWIQLSFLGTSNYSDGLRKDWTSELTCHRGFGRTHHVDVRFPKSRILFIQCPWFRWPTSAWANRVFLAKLLSGSIFSTYPKIIKNHRYSPFFAIVGSR